MKTSKVQSHFGKILVIVIVAVIILITLFLFFSKQGVEEIVTEEVEAPGGSLKEVSDERILAQYDDGLDEAIAELDLLS